MELTGYEIVGRLWLFVGQAFDGAEEVMGRYGLQPKSLALLTLVFDGRTPQELARELRTHPATLSHLVRELESRGLLRREIHPTDKRKVLLHRTPAGDEALARGIEAVNAAMAGCMSRLSDADLACLRQALHLLERMGSEA